MFVVKFSVSKYLYIFEKALGKWVYCVDDEENWGGKMFGVSVLIQKSAFSIFVSSTNTQQNNI